MRAGYDNIVIGAGTSGCVVAARLSEDEGRQVLLLEAGGSDRRLDIVMPAGFTTQFGNSKVDWNYITEPEAALAGRQIRSPRGKSLGGCSSMNAMAYIRGNRLDYDGWAESGATGWSYEEVLPYFRRSEDNKQYNDEYHGRGGPLTVTFPNHTDPVTAALAAGAAGLGLGWNEDWNGAVQDGFGPVQVTQRHGTRLNSARAFLRPALKRPNLTVHTHAQVSRVVFQGTRVVAVEYVHAGAARRAEVTGDVVLCAGAFGTPTVLQHSGLGPAAHLESVGIKPLVDLPAVGANLMEHPFMSVPYELKGESVGLFDAEKPQHLLRWLFRRDGKLSTNVAEHGGHWRSDPALPAPDVQFVFMPGHLVDHGAEKWPTATFTIGVCLLTPRSRGSVLVRDRDPFKNAEVRYNLLSDPSEVDVLAEAVLMARRIAATPQAETFAGEPAGPLAEKTDGDALRRAIRETAQHLYHPAGTARIGAAGDGVVDPELRVHGVTGLRVADVSVMPTITRGNTQAPAYMIGEKAADMVRGRRPMQSRPVPAAGLQALPA
jgi:choline dehydrogenase